MTASLQRNETSQHDNDDDTMTEPVFQSDDEDRGHRWGNFHNYYAFHSTAERVDALQPLLAHVVRVVVARGSGSGSKDMDSFHTCDQDSHIFRYCDLGCNEGDLTLKIARQLKLQRDLISSSCSFSSPISAFSDSDPRVDFIGMDVDPVLIRRADQKWKTDSMNSSATISGRFFVADLLLEQNNPLDTTLADHSVDLISLFSTTMWLHIHAGDDGLRRVLMQICRKSRRFVLIEPQPSKCYHNAMIRLRRLGRPEFDVSNERLQLRANIETEIDTIVESAGLSRVVMDPDEMAIDGGDCSRAISWNRSLRLYERRALT